MIKKILAKISDFRIQWAFARLRKELIKIDRELSVDETLNFLFSKKGSLVQPWQFKSEITNLFKKYKSLNSKYTLEIGTANGGSLFGHCKLAHPEATIISIDLPGGKYGGGYPEWKIPIYEQFACRTQKLHLLRASSHEQSTVDKVKNILQGNQLDYLFIDGDHSYAGVMKDFELYSPFVKSGGIVVFHDIVPHTNSSCKVEEFWNEIKRKFKHEEFIDHPDQNHFGVGILYLER